MARAPRVSPPAIADEPCQLYTLPADAQRDDLEVGYETRGAQVIACEGKRKLQKAANVEQHNALDGWEKARAKRRCEWWKFGMCKPPD